MAFDTCRAKVVAARAATGGSEHGAEGGAVGRLRVVVTEKMGAHAAHRWVSRVASSPTPGSSVPCAAS